MAQIDVSEIQLKSLIHRAEHYVKIFPGIDCEIICASLELKIEVVNPQIFADFFRIDILEVNERAEFFNINLSVSTQNLNTTAEWGVLPFSPYTKDTLNRIRKTPIITVADNSFNAFAKKEGIIVVNNTLLKNTQYLVIAALIIINIPWLIVGKSEEEIVDLFRAVGQMICLSTKYKDDISSFYTPRYHDIFAKAYGKLKEIRPKIDNYLIGIEARFLTFIIAHEYAHLALLHFDHKSIVQPELADWVDDSFNHEYEADMMACATIMNLCEAGKISKEVVGLQTIAMWGCSLLATPRRFKTASEILAQIDLFSAENMKRLENDPLFRKSFKKELGWNMKREMRGHPDWLIRMYLISFHFFEEMEETELIKTFSVMMYTMLNIQFHCEDIFGDE